MTARTALSVIPYLVHLYVKSRLEYRGAYVLAIIAQFMGYAAAYGTIWILLNRFSTLGGWDWPQLALLLSFQLLAYSLGAAFSFVQFREMQELVRMGTFDALLVKPFSPWAYLAFSGLNIGYLGHVILGVGLMVWALTQVGIAWTPGLVLFGLLSIASAAMLTAALITMIGATALILVRSQYLYSIYFGFWELTRYPLSIFPTGVQVVLYTVVPMGFLAYVPTARLLGKEVPLLGAFADPLALAAGPIVVLVAMAHWRYCIRHYQGGGG
jgi:ABC-2 type transport system permease protein